MSLQKFVITQDLFMQNKYLYRISSLYEKVIDTTGEESIDSKLAMETPERVN